MDGLEQLASNRNEFNRQFIFSLARDRSEQSLWLFGGIFEILARRPTPQARSYDVAFRDDLINHTLAELAVLVSQNRPDWRVALQHMKGVYVLHDRTTGEPYVGAAYGEVGIWDRLRQYTETLHGGNVGLAALVRDNGPAYAQNNLTFALLEYSTPVLRPPPPACCPSCALGGYSVEEVEVLPASLHGVDHEFVAAVEAEHDDLEEAAGGVESQAQLSAGAVLTQVADEDDVLGGVDGVIRSDAVLSSRLVDPQAT